MILDPSNKFILSPDLGADVVRVFSIGNSKFGHISECAPLKVTPGTGPRHAAFSSTAKNTTHMYLASELANNVSSYSLQYLNTNCLGFQEIQTGYPYPESPPADSAVAEIRVSVSSVTAPEAPLFQSSELFGKGAFTWTHYFSKLPRIH